MNAEIAWRNLQQALMAETPACEGDERFVGDGRGGTQTASMRARCDSCPLLDLCAAYVNAETPRNMAGFWAGGWRTKDPR